MRRRLIACHHIYWCRSLIQPNPGKRAQRHMSPTTRQIKQVGWNKINAFRLMRKWLIKCMQKHASYSQRIKLLSVQYHNPHMLDRVGYCGKPLAVTSTISKLETTAMRHVDLAIRLGNFVPPRSHSMHLHLLRL